MRRSGVTWLLACSVALMVNWLSLFSAYRYGSISVATVVDHTQPFMLLALAVALQGERLQRERQPWVALAFAGVVLIAELHRAGPGGATWQGVALALLAAFLYAAVVLMTRRLNFYDVRPSVAQWVGMAAIVLAVVADQRKWTLGLPWWRPA